MPKGTETRVRNVVSIHGWISKLNLKPPPKESSRAVMILTIEAAVEDRNLIPDLARKIETSDVQDITIAPLQAELGL
jgi:hypothetical protein